MKALTYFGIILLGCSSVYCHIWSFGKCVTPPPFKDFDVNKFIGKWYEIQVSSHWNPCLTLEFTRKGNSNDSFIVTESKELSALMALGRSRKFTHNGTLTVPDKTVPADMNVKWPESVLGKSSFTVLDTNYANYSLIFECQQILFVSRSSFSILSRHPTLDEPTIQSLRTKVELAGGDPSKMTNVNQTICLPDNVQGGTHLNATLHEEGIFNGLGLLNDDIINTINNTEDLIHKFNWTLPEGFHINPA